MQYRVCRYYLLSLSLARTRLGQSPYSTALRYNRELAFCNHPAPPANPNYDPDYGANLEHPFLIAYPMNATRAWKR